MVAKPAVTEQTSRTLAGIEIFRDLPAEDLRMLAQRCRWMRYDANQVIINRLDDTKDVFFLVSGRVRMTIYTTSGREVLLADLEPSSIFGELSAIDGFPQLADVIALSDSLVAALPTSIFWDIVRRYNGVAEALLVRLARMVRMQAERIYEFSALSSQRRILAELLRLAREQGEPSSHGIMLRPLTHAEIANRVSTHREAVTRELSNLARVGLIERRQGRLVIRDVVALEQMFDEAEA